MKISNKLTFFSRIDSVLLLNNGFDVVSVDASDKMLKHALKIRWERRKEESFDKWGKKKQLLDKNAIIQIVTQVIFFFLNIYVYILFLKNKAFTGKQQWNCLWFTDRGQQHITVQIKGSFMLYVFKNFQNNHISHALLCAHAKVSQKIIFFTFCYSYGRAHIIDNMIF